jgi:rhombotail lipoprotein
MRRRQAAFFVPALAATAVLAGCASANKSNKQRQVASVLTFLFPDSKDGAPPVSTQVAVIKVPFRIGVAFVPDTTQAEFRLSETERQQLATRVRDAFTNYPFISRIEAVPSLYLEPRGGFDNLDRVAALLNLDAIALISYDQVQHADASGWSFLYWTGVGAYVVEGDRYEVLTAVECTVFDVKSRRLLMRASGISTNKGEATMVGFGEKAREGRAKSFGVAMEQMIIGLQKEVQSFRETAPKDPMIKLILPPGYDPKAIPAAR